MMVPTFAAMALALLALHGRRPRWAIACALLTLALSTGLFLFEIHSPDTGFRMPWLQG